MDLFLIISNFIMQIYHLFFQFDANIIKLLIKCN